MIGRPLLLALLPLAGCLSILPAPHQVAVDACRANDCAPYLCDARGACLTSCDYTFECTDDAICADDGRCEVVCRDDCPDHLACDPLDGGCPDRCFGDGDCVDGYRCCSVDDRDAGLCDFGECVAG